MRRFPRGMAPSTLGEREGFYTDEFDVRSLDRWMRTRIGLKYAMILGRHTRIVLPRYEPNRDDVMVIDEHVTARDLREFALQHLPESMYYDRNRYVDLSACARCRKDRLRCLECRNCDGQQLAFDLDPENVACPYHGTIDDKMSAGRGLSFCMYEFKEVRRQAARLSELLERDFEDVHIVYSGRGFHVVVEDERAYSMTVRARAALARRVAREYSIDEWVTVGRSRLLRLPLSLNGLVSRVCTRMKDRRSLVSFDPRTSSSVVPSFRGSS